MASLTDHAETLLATWLLTDGSATRPTAWRLALYTAAPSDAGGGTEVSAGGYARQEIAFTVSGDTASNDAAITFGPATGAWGEVTHIGVHDAETGGNLIAWDVLLDTEGAPASKDIANTDTLEFAAGDLDFTFD